MLRALRWQLRRWMHPIALKRLNALRAKHENLETALKYSGKYEIDLLIRPYAHSRAKNTLKRLEIDLLRLGPLSNKRFGSGEFCCEICALPKVISEGLFSLLLRFNDEKLYQLSLSIYDEYLLICCAQGLADASSLKSATKAAFGLRPINLALHIAAAIAQRLDLKLAGVKNCAQISNFKRAKHEFINYDELWQQNAQITEVCEEFYELEIIKKELEQIASKKRSEYRKRYALIDQITKEFHEIR